MCVIIINLTMRSLEVCMCMYNRERERERSQCVCASACARDYSCALRCDDVLKGHGKLTAGETAASSSTLV